MSSATQSYSSSFTHMCHQHPNLKVLLSCYSDLSPPPWTEQLWISGMIVLTNQRWYINSWIKLTLVEFEIVTHRPNPQFIHEKNTLYVFPVYVLVICLNQFHIFACFSTVVSSNVFIYCILNTRYSLIFVAMSLEYVLNRVIRFIDIVLIMYSTLSFTFSLFCTNSLKCHVVVGRRLEPFVQSCV